MKYYTFAWLLFCLICSCNAQPAQKQQQSSRFSFDGFEEEVIAYKPEQREGVSEKSYAYAQMILDEVKSATKGKPENFNRGDYMNLLSAFLTLNEARPHLDITFQKLQEAEGSCEYLKAFESNVRENEKYAYIRDRWLSALAECEHQEGSGAHVQSPKAYADAHQLDEGLVRLIVAIEADDHRYRDRNQENWASLQRPLDINNQRRIDSLYQVYGTYIGTSMVGPKYTTVMWAVIQHSNIEMMERYLPVVHQAYVDGEIQAGPLKMLIDRFYGLKYGYQVFGTQSGFGFELADEATRRSVKEQYNMD